MSQWKTNESMNQRSNEFNEWTNEFVDGWMDHGWMMDDGWMDGRMDGWVVKLLLHWATSSLRHLFSQLLLLRASALKCLPATSSLASPVANPQSSRVAPNWPTLAQRQQSDPLRFLCDFCETELSLQSRARSSDLIFQKCSKHASFLTFSSANRDLAGVLRAFVGNLPGRGMSRPAAAEREALYFSDPRSHITRKKTQGSHTRAFHPWIHTLPHCCTSQLNWRWVVGMMMWLTW